MNYKHSLKSWVGLFEPIASGKKTHDLRVMDRDYQVGDICALYEWEPTKREYTGKFCYVEITFITSSKHGECAFSPTSLHPATAILSIKLLEPDTFVDADGRDRFGQPHYGHGSD